MIMISFITKLHEKKCIIVINCLLKISRLLKSNCVAKLIIYCNKLGLVDWLLVYSKHGKLNLQFLTTWLNLEVDQEIL